MTTEEQKRIIGQMLNDGQSLSEVQKCLSREHGVGMTYLELRLLAAEVEVDWDKHEPEKPAEPAADTPTPDTPLEPEVMSGTHITVHKVVRPGAAMSGEVTFASGATAEWYLDNFGRLGLNPTEGSERPTQDDIQDFQIELQRKLSGGA